MAYVLDNATPILIELQKRSPGLALDTIDHVAVVANKAIRKRIANAARVDWHQRISSSGKRVIFHQPSVIRGYQRHSHKDASLIGDMQSFVINKLYASKMKAVVGFQDVKGFSPDKYRGGQIVGKLKYQKGTHMGKIGEKLEGGGPLTGFFAGSGGRYIGRPVVAPAKREIFGRAQTIAQKALDQAMREFKAEMGAA